MAELFMLTGLDGVRQRLEQLPAQLLFLGGLALKQEADEILEKSQPLVPVDTGALVQSGTSHDFVLRGQVAEAKVSYGGPGTGGRRPELYAWIVHQDVTMRHPRGGQSHYLSQPTFAATEGMLARIAEQLRNAL